MSWASLSLKNLTNALREVDDWQDLGIQLDIKYHELQKFVSEHQKTEERKRAMLQFWLDRDTQASWKKVISALSEMKLNRVAEEIKRKYQMPPSTQSEDVPPLVPTVTTEPENVPTADPPSIPPTDQPEQTPTTPSEGVPVGDSPSALQTESAEETSVEGVRNVQLEIAALVAMYDELVAKTVETFSERQEDSPIFFRKLRTTVAVLPTSMKYQHKYFLEQHFSQIARATTVEEIFSILSRYCNFLNCGLLAYIISKFGDEELQKQLTKYTVALQTFRSRTKITDFVKTCTGKQIIVPECVSLKMKLGSEWEHCTLQDAEEYHKSMADSSSLADYVLYLEKVASGSIYLSWRVPSHATDLLVSAINFEFLQHHRIEEFTIDNVDLEEYKRRHYIPSLQLINQHVDELSEGLVWASREGCLEDVVFLLSTGVEVNSRGQWRGRTALMRASEGGYLDVVKELLRAQAGVDIEDELGRTALMKASGSGHTAVVQLLLSSGAQVNLQKWGENALMLASGSGHTAVVQLLLSSGAQVDLQDKSGRTALMLASERGHTAVVQLLLSSGAQVDLQDKRGLTALMMASGSGHTDVVQLLLSSGAQVDLQDNWGETALILASGSGHTAVVQLLLSSGAQVDLQETLEGWTPLMMASVRGHTDVVQLLLSSGAQVDLQSEWGETALILASGSGHTAVVQLLLSSGAQVDLQDVDGRTALTKASSSGHTAVVQLLISSGAQVDLQNKGGLTALIHVVKPRSYSVSHDKTGTVKALLAAGADVNHQEKTSGRSAVFYAAEDGDLEMVKLLIWGGANLNLKDKDGVTADQVAEVKGHHAVCEELRKHMHGDHRPLNKTVRDRVLATGQFLRALYKRLEERILRTQKKELARTQGLDSKMILPRTPSRKGVKDPKGLRQQEENIPGHVH